jgi:hypothetical protein
MNFVAAAHQRDAAMIGAHKRATCPARHLMHVLSAPINHDAHLLLHTHAGFPCRAQRR